MGRACSRRSSAACSCACASRTASRCCNCCASAASPERCNCASASSRRVSSSAASSDGTSSASDAKRLSRSACLCRASWLRRDSSSSAAASRGAAAPRPSRVLTPSRTSAPSRSSSTAGREAGPVLLGSMANAPSVRPSGSARQQRAQRGAICGRTKLCTHSLEESQIQPATGTRARGCNATCVDPSQSLDREHMTHRALAPCGCGAAGRHPRGLPHKALEHAGRRRRPPRRRRRARCPGRSP